MLDVRERMPHKMPKLTERNLTAEDIFLIF